jgi:hypothetical protein
VYDLPVWHCSLPAQQLEQSILEFAEGLRVYGISPNETVALIADNSHRWLIADQGSRPNHDIFFLGADARALFSRGFAVGKSESFITLQLVGNDVCSFIIGALTAKVKERVLFLNFYSWFSRLHGSWS